jgi:hypothetical protein
VLLPSGLGATLWARVRKRRKRDQNEKRRGPKDVPPNENGDDEPGRNGGHDSCESKENTQATHQAAKGNVQRDEGRPTNKSRGRGLR